MYLVNYKKYNGFVYTTDNEYFEIRDEKAYILDKKNEEDREKIIFNKLHENIIDSVWVSRNVFTNKKYLCSYRFDMEIISNCDCEVSTIFKDYLFSYDNLIIDIISYPNDGFEDIKIKKFDPKNYDINRIQPVKNILFDRVYNLTTINDTTFSLLTTSYATSYLDYCKIPFKTVSYSSFKP